MNNFLSFILFSLIIGVLCEYPTYTTGSGYNFKKLLHSKPSNVDLSFDCKAKIAAYQYAQIIQPNRNLKLVFDALELGTACNQAEPEFKETKKVLPIRDGASFYVNPSNGSDSNSGTIDTPFLTIGRALAATRAVDGPNSIILREGTFYLPDTIRLGPEDSQLTITNYNGEEVYISGGLSLVLNWKPYNVSSSPSIKVYQNVNVVWGRAEYKADTPTIKYLGSFNNTSQCQKACVLYNKDGLSCKAFTYHLPQYNSTWATLCYAVVDDTWSPVLEQNITSGRILQMNVYVADLTGQVDHVLGLQRPKGGKRATRARFPNADIETSVFPAGWVLYTENYMPPKQYPLAETVVVTSPQRTDITEFQQWSMGIGGPCSIFDPPESYWCSADCSGGGAGIFETPTGLRYPVGTFLDNEWEDPDNAIIHMWHPYHWAMWMYEVDDHDPVSRNITWSYGGFQGARGAISDNGKGGEWYVENVFEMLDAPNEFYFDSDNNLLYYFYNGTGSPPTDFQLDATNLKTLISVSGTKRDPVVGLTIQGINFVNAAYTFLDPHGVPSGGDWAMQRSGALFFEGTELLTVNSCTFRRLDGNALILSGYHRNATISNSDFQWIGDSVMVAWGYTDGIDGTNGEQPRFTNIIGNIASEIGHFEKQASQWFQAKTTQTLLKDNIFFNGPRALINFNDGFGGANEIVNNLLFNANRETSDQGPFNSWDRLPFLTDILDGTPQLTPAYNNIHHNFMICNYGSNMCIDNDDGSSYYNNYNNFEIYGGHKSDFGGHNKFTFNTVMAYAQDYQYGLCGDFWDAVPGYVDGYFNNICIQGAPVPYLNLDSCDPNNPRVVPILFNNTVYNVNGTTAVTCGSTQISERDFQKLGFDLGTTTGFLPSDDQIIAWGKALLGM